MYDIVNQLQMSEQLNADPFLTKGELVHYEYQSLSLLRDISFFISYSYRIHVSNWALVHSGSKPFSYYSIPASIIQSLHYW